jgi:transcriptional regulator with XRE-family HTH domain
MSMTLTKRQGNQAGAQLRSARMNAGLSPEELGHRLGISGRTIRRVEDGALPTVRIMFALAAWMDTDVVDLWRL